jgi:hypothetical protein
LKINSTENYLGASQWQKIDFFSGSQLSCFKGFSDKTNYILYSRYHFKIFMGAELSNIPSSVIISDAPKVKQYKEILLLQTIPGNFASSLNFLFS